MHNALRASLRCGPLPLTRQSHGSACPNLDDLAGEKRSTGLIRPAHLTRHVAARRGAAGLDLVGLSVLDLRAVDGIAFEHGVVPLFFAGDLGCV